MTPPAARPELSAYSRSSAGSRRMGIGSVARTRSRPVLPFGQRPVQVSAAATMVRLPRKRRTAYL